MIGADDEVSGSIVALPPLYGMVVQMTWSVGEVRMTTMTKGVGSKYRLMLPVLLFRG